MNDIRGQIMRVGLLVVGSIVATGAIIFLIGQQQHLWEHRVEYKVRFIRTNGLQVGAPVALTGVTIGSVRSIEFPANPSAQHVIVRVAVSRETARRIHTDTTASIRTLGLLGDKYIELSAGTLEADLLPPGSFLQAIDPIDYEAVLGQSGDIVTNIIEVTGSMKNVLQAIEQGEGLLGEVLRNRQAGEQVLDNFNRTMNNLQQSSHSLAVIVERLESGKGVLGALLEDSERPREIIERLDNASRAFEALAVKMNAAGGLLPRLVEDEEYGTRLTTDLARAAQNLADVLEKINRGEGTLGRLVNDPTLYHDVNKLVSQTSDSWLFGIYRGMRSLWPFGHHSPSEPGVSPQATSP